MTHPDPAALADDVTAAAAAGETGPADAEPSPWDGIPATVLSAASGYDADSAGGCG
jgi:hypothetical protein